MGYRWFGVTAEVKGSAVRGLKAIFKKVWNQSTKVYLVNEREMLPISKDEVGQKVKVEDVVGFLKGKNELRGLIVAYSEPWRTGFYRKLLFRRDDLRDLVGASIASAQKEVKIITPNLSSYRIIYAIARALMRGAKVKLMLSKDFNEDINLIADPDNVGDNVRALIALKGMMLLLHEGDKLKNLEVRWYSNDGVHPAVGNYEETSHAKYLSVDGKLAAYGSMNQDITSQKICRELNVIDVNPQEVRELEAKFFPKVWNRGVPVDLDKLPNPFIYLVKSLIKGFKSVMKRFDALKKRT